MPFSTLLPRLRHPVRLAGQPAEGIDAGGEDIRLAAHRGGRKETPRKGDQPFGVRCAEGLSDATDYRGVGGIHPDAVLPGVSGQRRMGVPVTEHAPREEGRVEGLKKTLYALYP